MEDRLRDTVVGDPLRSLKQAIVGPIRRLLMFPLRPIAWGMAIAAIAEPADVWHGMWAGSLPGILHLRSRLGGVAVYDSRDIYLHARYFDRMSRPWRAIFRRIERHWARRCDAVITVNQAYADILVRTLGIAPPAIVMNCPDRFDPPEPRPDRIRAELGLGPDRAVVLYQGNLMTERGIEQGMDAILEVPDADLVLLGYGGLKPVLAGQVAGPPFLGRVHLLEAVPPSELLDWTCSADVMLMAIQPTTINHRYTTPNKLWEAMAAGIPVVASDLPGMAAIVRETGCGVLCDPTSPADIARAIRSILELPAEGRAAVPGGGPRRGARPVQLGPPGDDPAGRLRAPDRPTGYSSEGHIHRGGFMNEDRRLAIIGLGYVGLPLAISFVEAGLDVEGVDAQPSRVAELSAGRSPIDDIPDARLSGAIAAGMRVVGTDEARLAEADVIFVCVPTPIDQAKDPDLGPVLSAAELIRGSLRKGQLVILQSTTFPGTTTGPFRTVLEGSGLVAGTDFDLAFAPERVNPGDPASAAKGVPRLVGATTPAATARAAALLRRINDAVIELSSPDAAELAKILENVFRNVNIALVNQLALLCERMGIDVWEVISAAATKPFGFMKFTPGPGVGGHCIPVDPYYLAWRAREFDFVDRFVELAGDINFAMPRHVVDLVGEGLNDRGRALKGARVGVLGVAFKPDVRDSRNSPAAAILAGLAARGADVTYHDPHVPRFVDTDGVARESIALEPLLGESDVVVVVTPHRAIDWDRVYGGAPLVIDTVDSSRGRSTKERQVLRLGAGWSTRQ